MEFSPQQDDALKAVARWLKSGRPQVFRLFGWAVEHAAPVLVDSFPDGSRVRGYEHGAHVDEVIRERELLPDSIPIIGAALS